MLENLKVYQHGFFAPSLLDPPTLDILPRASLEIWRVDYLFLKDLIYRGKIKPEGYDEVEVLYAILTEPKIGNVVFKQPYKAHIRYEDPLTQLKTEKIASHLPMDALVKLIGESEKNNILIKEFVDSLAKL
jgi:hypothetical protein